MELIRAYMDGSSINNKVGTGKGGWCYSLVRVGHSPATHSGSFTGTNNEGELRALLKTLIHIKNSRTDAVVEIYSDSSYVLKHILSFSIAKGEDLIFVGALHSIKDLTGILATRTPSHYEELWRDVVVLLTELTNRHTFYLWWIRGHLPKDLDRIPQSLRCHAKHHRVVDDQARAAALNGVSMVKNQK